MAWYYEERRIGRFVKSRWTRDLLFLYLVFLRWSLSVLKFILIVPVLPTQFHWKTLEMTVISTFLAVSSEIVICEMKGQRSMDLIDNPLYQFRFRPSLTHFLSIMSVFILKKVLVTTANININNWSVAEFRGRSGWLSLSRSWHVRTYQWRAELRIFK